MVQFWHCRLFFMVVAYSLIYHPVKVSFSASNFQNISEYEGERIDYPNYNFSISFTTTLQIGLMYFFYASKIEYLSFSKNDSPTVIHKILYVFLIYYETFCICRIWKNYLLWNRRNLLI